MDEKQLMIGVVELKLPTDYGDGPQSMFVRAEDITIVHAVQRVRPGQRSPQLQAEYEAWSLAEDQRIHDCRIRDCMDDDYGYRTPPPPRRITGGTGATSATRSTPARREVPAHLISPRETFYTCAVTIRHVSGRFDVANTLEELQGYIRNS